MNFRNRVAMVSIGCMCVAVAACSGHSALRSASQTTTTDAIAVTGTAGSNADVAALLRKVEHDGLLEQPTLDYMRASGDGFEFRISGHRPGAEIASSGLDGK